MSEIWAGKGEVLVLNKNKTTKLRDVELNSHINFTNI